MSLVVTAPHSGVQLYEKGYRQLELLRNSGEQQLHGVFVDHPIVQALFVSVTVIFLAFVLHRLWRVVRPARVRANARFV